MCPDAPFPQGVAPPDQSATLSAPSTATLPASGPVAVPGYEVLGELGRGGMGVVYKARQISLDRVVALKMILAGTYAAHEELARFRREAEAVARLQHPNIVQVFEIGEHEGRPFFSLEYCPGGNLGKRLAGTPLPTPSATGRGAGAPCPSAAGRCAGGARGTVRRGSGRPQEDEPAPPLE